MGTVVFPGANLKIFLWASPEVRAHRRFLELRERGLPAKEPEVLRDVLERDRIDSTRETAPLAEAVDAVRIDCSALSAEAVTERVVALARSRGAS
jgi:cytidylate kinase